MSGYFMQINAASVVILETIWRIALYYINLMTCQYLRIINLLLLILFKTNLLEKEESLSRIETSYNCHSLTLVAIDINCYVGHHQIIHIKWTYDL